MPGVEIRDGYGLLIRIETWEPDIMTQDELVIQAENCPEPSYMKDYPLSWIHDALWHFGQALGSIGSGIRCLWWAWSSWIDYIRLIKILREIEWPGGPPCHRDHTQDRA